jgi:hypothetical protein
MKKIDSIFDSILKVNVDLYSYSYFELRAEVKTWYNGVDLSLFDRRTKYSISEKDGDKNLINKISGIISNYFYAYKDKSGKMYLLDGYNRLLSDFGNLDIDTTVYLKVITEEDEEFTSGKLMSIMFILNGWKLSKNGSDDMKFWIDNFLDRGFKLFLYTKFGIIINERKRHDDIDILDEYFRDESESVAYFNYNSAELFLLFKQERIIEDFKHILRHNDYDDDFRDDKIFNNYNYFLQGYVRFISRRRLKNDFSEHLFETYLDILKADKKFFSKLKTMCGNDSTRKNIFLFFDKIEKNL